jgi:nucleotide-binding universal stress UspA family protein
VKRVSHILCPTDFSPLANQGLKLSLRLAEELRAKLTVLHVDELSSMNIIDTMALERLRQEARQRIEKHLSTLRNNHDLSRARFEIAEGYPQEVIVDKIGELGVDLLVMGTHGESGWKTLHLGSLTEKVLHASTVPLLAVPDLGRKEPFGRKTKRILLAVDLGYTSKETVSYATYLAKKFDAELFILNVAYSSEELFPELGSFWARGDLVALKAQLEQKRTNAMDKLLHPSTRKTLRYKLLVREGDPHEVIDQTAREKKVDLVVVGAKGKGQSRLDWIGSTTHKVVRLGACATLVVK